MEKEYKWIRVVEAGNSPSGKTKIFHVINKESLDLLGVIKWNGGWRKYAFYPNSDTYYEEDCLNNISEFLEELKTERRLN